MKLFTVGLSLLLAGAMSVSTASADVIITVQTPATPLFANSGIQTIDVFFRSSESGGEFISDIGVDFDLSGGALFESPIAGTFSGAGFLTQIDAGGSSFFDNGGGNATLSIFYNAIAQPANQILLEQALPDMDVLFARLNIDTSGLVPGTYDITSSSRTVLTSPTALFSSGTIFSETPLFNAGSFTIAAVPEPGSFGVLAVVGAGAWLQRRRFAKKSASSAA